MCLRDGWETHRPPRNITDLGFKHIGFKVDDLRETYERLKDLFGFDSQPRPKAGRHPRMTVFLRDKDSVEMHFVQE